ncbi:hypothetical protein CC80DRAFT_497944, partial [Byssothecium circinans]
MVAFLSLPRELRDLIYTEVILWERPRPTLGHPQWLSFRFRRVSYAQSSVTGEFGCAYSLEPTPTTCANFLCCNRQVHKEMLEAIALIRKKAARKSETALEAKMDCIAEDESFHYFTWLSIPLVTTSPAVIQGKSRILPAWMDTWMAQYVSYPHSWLSCGPLAMRTRTAQIATLCVDVRLTGDRANKWTRNSGQSDRTSWAVCAALKRWLENGLGVECAASTADALPSFSGGGGVAGKKMAPPRLSIAELVLNVVPPPNYPAAKFLPQDARGNEVREGMVCYLPSRIQREWCAPNTSYTPLHIHISKTFHSLYV